MTTTRDMSAGGYRYIPAVFQYSGGVAALPGYRIERVRFAQVVALAAGFERIAAHLEAVGRPPAAFCACELRSPAPFTEDSFKRFNQDYFAVLRRWGIVEGEVNPVARTNVCPELDPPAEPGFHAFSYTVARQDDEQSFIVAGSGETPEGKSSYRDHIVRLGDTSPDALREKARWVLDEMERRMAAFGAGWGEATASQVYTVHDIYPFLADELIHRGAGRHGVTWHYTRPPVVDLEYEMDCRRVPVEHILPA
jgi:hypothetical protein